MMRELCKYIDHTCLKPFSQDKDIIKLCSEAAEYHFASVCVNPCDVPLAKKLLTGSDVAVCTVIGFPLGKNSSDIKVAETLKAEEDGCDEFDMVINVGWLKDQKYELIRKEISSVVGAAGDRIVKVILETGLLTDDEIVKAVKISCDSGAKFVKTCTGFSDGKATAHAVKLMKQSVSGGVLVKASGGIRTYIDAVTMIEAGADRLGTSSGVAIIRESKQAYGGK